MRRLDNLAQFWTSLVSMSSWPFFAKPHIPRHKDLFGRYFH